MRQIIFETQKADSKKCTTFEQLPAAVNLLIEEVTYLRKVIDGRFETEEPRDKKYITSVVGLATFLNCSVPTAQKLKNSGKIPFKQFGRKIIVDPKDVAWAIQKNNKKA